MRQAQAADEHRRHGRDTGPLHGVPIGIKDIFDTGDMPTEFGSPFWAGRTPRADAAAVARLRAAGAVIMGKTVTTEYAYYPSRQDPQSARSGAHAGRLVERLGRGGRRPMVPGAHRLADQRLGDPSGGLLRRGRLQADPRAYSAHRRADAVAHARPCRRVRAHRRGCGVAGRGAGRLRRRRIPIRGRSPARRSPPWRRASRRCRRASPSSASPAWEQAEPVTQRGLRRAGRGARRAGRRGRARIELREHARPAPHRHGSRDGAQPPSRLRAGPRPAQRRFCAPRSSAAAAASAVATTCAPSRRSATLNARARRDLQRIRRDPHAGGAGRGAARPRGDRQSGVLHDLDLSRHAGRDAAADGDRGRGCRSASSSSAAATTTRASCARRAGLSKHWGVERRRADARPPRAVRHAQEGTIAMITTLITGVIGIAMLATFLGFMLWWVKALPLIIIVAVVDGAADLRFRVHAAPRRRRSRALSCPNQVPAPFGPQEQPTSFVMKIAPPASVRNNLPRSVTSKERGS